MVNNKILLIDDQESHFDAICKGLTECNWQVVPGSFDEISYFFCNAKTLEKFYDHVEKLIIKEDPYAAIVDLAYGDDTRFGIKVIEKIRESMLFIPILVFTRHPNMQEETIRVKATYFLEKPDFNNLENMTKSIISPYLEASRAFFDSRNLDEIKNNQEYMILPLSLNQDAVLLKLDDIEMQIQENRILSEAIFTLGTHGLSQAQRKKVKDYFEENFGDLEVYVGLSEELRSRTKETLMNGIGKGLREGSIEVVKECINAAAGEAGIEDPQSVVASTLWLLGKGLLHVRKFLSVSS